MNKLDAWLQRMTYMMQTSFPKAQAVNRMPTPLILRDFIPQKQTRAQELHHKHLEINYAILSLYNYKSCSALYVW